MCNRVDNSGISMQEISNELSAEISEGRYNLATEQNAFQRPALPIVLDHNGRHITHGTWGIYKEIPKDKPAKGINLTAEKTHTFYKNFRDQRCVVPVSGFYDWTHVTNPGKKTPLKVKHRVTWKDADHFYLAAFYDVWDNKEIGFGLITTGANHLMSIVHNSKMRMPLCMDAKAANRFLQGEKVEDFIYPAYDPNLAATNIEPHKLPNTLF